jgi:hypothetical protein
MKYKEIKAKDVPKEEVKEVVHRETKEEKEAVRIAEEAANRIP